MALKGDGGVGNSLVCYVHQERLPGYLNYLTGCSFPKACLAVVKPNVYFKESMHLGMHKLSF